MKRDMDLIRKILLKIEDTVDNVVQNNIEIEGYTTDQVAYHCSILYEGGYVHDYKGLYGCGELISFEVGRLTWDGHDFLDKIRKDTIWNKTRGNIMDLSVTIWSRGGKKSGKIIDTKRRYCGCCKKCHDFYIVEWEDHRITKNCPYNMVTYKNGLKLL